MQAKFQHVYPSVDTRKSQSVGCAKKNIEIFRRSKNISNAGKINYLDRGNITLNTSRPR